MSDLKKRLESRRERDADNAWSHKGFNENFFAYKADAWEGGYLAGASERDAQVGALVGALERVKEMNLNSKPMRGYVETFIDNQLSAFHRWLDGGKDE